MLPTYAYAKERRQFGRQCLFSDRNELLYNEPTNRKLFENYILRNPVNSSTQKGKQMALSVVNTDNVEYTTHGVNHTEGGWPKDLNYLDSEQTLRYRKKIERDDIWAQQVLSLTKVTFKFYYIVAVTVDLSLHPFFYSQWKNAYCKIVPLTYMNIFLRI